MRSKKTASIATVLFFFFPIAGGTGAYLAFTNLAAEEPEIQQELTTRFYIVNESEIVAGKPAIYNVEIENMEGAASEYTLKVYLEGNEVYDQKIVVNYKEKSNQMVSFTPRLTGDYQKLEFILYKNGEPYRTRILQIFPAIDYSTIPEIRPPSLQNGNMENSTMWKFSGKDFSGNYASSDWSTGRRSYLVRTPTGVKEGSSGSIEQEFSNDETGMASLSFDVRSDNISYVLQSLLNDEIVWEKNAGYNWTRIKVPVFLKKSNRLELRVTAMNVTNTGVNVWWDNIRFENHTSSVTETQVEKEIIKENVFPAHVHNYTVKKNGSNYSYLFDSGETLELTVTDGNVSPGGAVYTTKVNGNYIEFLGELHEKLLPNNLHHLVLVTLELRDINMGINDTVDLKNDYTVKFTNITDIGLMMNISRNNRTVMEMRSIKNSSMTYSKYVSLDSYKKDMILQIIPKTINESNATFDILQYGKKKILNKDDNYEELKVRNVTEDFIVMNNSIPIAVESGKILSLVKGKIKIKVET